MLQRILRGRLTFTPQIDGRSGAMVGDRFEGPTRFDKLFAGIAGSAPKHVDRHDRSGTEHIRPEETVEGTTAACSIGSTETTREGWRPRAEIATCMSECAGAFRWRPIRRGLLDGLAPQ